MTESEEISLYEKAAQNDFIFIMKFIKEHPDFINRPCQYKNVRKEQTRTNVGLSMIAGLGSILTASIPPVALGFFAVQLCTATKGLYNQTVNERDRTNQTLLEYAAEGGATAVAVWLISQGADITDTHFKELARRNGHEALIKACEQEMQTRNNRENKRKRNKEKLADARISASIHSYERNLLSCTVDGLNTQNESLKTQRASTQEELNSVYGFLRDYELLDNYSLENPVPSSIDTHPAKKESPATEQERAEMALLLREMEANITMLFKIMHGDYPDVLKARAEQHHTRLTEDYAIYKAEYLALTQTSSPAIKAPVISRGTFFAPSLKEKYKHPSRYYYGLSEIKHAPYDAGDCFLDSVIALLPADQIFDNYPDMPGKCYNSVQFYHDWQQSSLKKDGSISDVEAVESISFPYRQWLKQFFRNKTSEYIASSTKYGTLIEKTAYPEKIVVGTEDEIICKDRKTFSDAIKKPFAYFNDTAINAFCDCFEMTVAIIQEDSQHVEYFGQKHFKKDNPPLFIGHVAGNHFVPLRRPTSKSLETLLTEIEDQSPLASSLSI